MGKTTHQYVEQMCRTTTPTTTTTTQQRQANEVPLILLQPVAALNCYRSFTLL